MTRSQLLGAGAALALVSCATTQPKVGPWVVSGGTPEEQAQALAIVDAGLRLFPRSALQFGSTVVLSGDIDYECGYRWPESDGVLHYAGCSGGGIWVLWPHPRCPANADLTCSALAHEVAHIGLGVWGNDEVSQGRADAAALLVVQEYRRSKP